jgi:oligopeptide transport system ATP-binding protein
MSDADVQRVAAATPLLDVRDLTTTFHADDRVVRAVDGVSFTVGKGEAVGIVGESGSGKSATALSILGLLPERATTAGSVVFDGADVFGLLPAALRSLRGRRIAMVFQDPMTSLNPYLRVEDQLAEVAVLHLRLSRRDAKARAVALLDRVGIADAKSRMRSYPHELSGGMRQRVMIAMALLCDPDLLILDEPTTALDVTIQAQLLELLRELRRERGLSIVLITHDLGIVLGLCDRVMVMYAGRIVESAPVIPLFRRPLHPYTLALLASVPRLDGSAEGRLASIGGMPPRLDQGPFRECTFAPRCTFVHDACRTRDPDLVVVEPASDGVSDVSAASATRVPPERARRCVLPLERMP